MSNHYEKKDKKEIKSKEKCIYCSRLLTASEIFFYIENCSICEIKFGPMLKPLEEKI